MLLVSANAGVSGIHRLGLIANEHIPVGAKVTEHREGFDLSLTIEQVEELPPAVREQVLNHAFFHKGHYLLDSDGGHKRRRHHRFGRRTAQSGGRFCMPEVETCYACEKPALTREHAPSRNFFPHGFRKDLVTVPSCSKHNLGKSKDDEHFRNVVTATVENNIPGREVVSAFLRSIKRRPHLKDTFLPNFKPVQLGNRKTASFTVNAKRFNRSARYLIRALYFNDNGKKLHTNIEITWRLFRPWNLQEDDRDDNLKLIESVWPDSHYLGLNREVFKWDFHVSPPAKKSMHICRMSFFGGAPIIGHWDRTLKLRSHEPA